jgi:hypothetical protein
MDEHDPMDEHELDRALADADGTLGAQLRELLDPEQDVRRRTADDVDRTLRSRSTFSAALDLLGVGWWTARSVLGDDTAAGLSSGPPAADREGGGS